MILPRLVFLPNLPAKEGPFNIVRRSMVSYEMEQPSSKFPPFYAYLRLRGATNDPLRQS